MPALRVSDPKLGQALTRVVDDIHEAVYRQLHTIYKRLYIVYVRYTRGCISSSVPGPESVGLSVPPLNTIKLSSQLALHRPERLSLPYLTCLERVPPQHVDKQQVMIFAAVTLMKPLHVT